MKQIRKLEDLKRVKEGDLIQIISKSYPEQKETFAGVHKFKNVIGITNNDEETIMETKYHFDKNEIYQGSFTRGIISSLDKKNFQKYKKIIEESK